jgi:hypothetical protein
MEFLSLSLKREKICSPFWKIIFKLFFIKEDYFQIMDILKLMADYFQVHKRFFS